MENIVALFGEAEKGDFRIAHFCQNLIDLANKLGEPPSKDSQGIELAIQAILYQHNVMFFRVHEEGFSVQDYLKGLSYLEDSRSIPKIAAVCLPGVGSGEIIEATIPICTLHQSFLILTEKDLYDYLTSREQ